MAENEEEDALQPQGEERSSLPVAAASDKVGDLGLKMRYFGAAAVPLSVILEVMGAQAPGLALAAGVGITAAYFSRELHSMLQPGLRTAGDVLAYLSKGKSSGRTVNRLMSKNWWLGEDIAPYVADNDVSEEDHLKQDEKTAWRSAPSRSGTSDLTLDIGPTLRPHVNSFFGSRIGVFGIPGSGKSNTVAVLLEELGEYQCPLLVLDTENENAELCTLEYFLNPNRESALSINPENAYAWGQAIMECNLQVILNLQSYPSDDAAAEVMVGLVEGVNDWEESQRVRIPCVIVLDEAHKWLPQSPGMSSLSKVKDEDGFTLLQRIQRCFLGTVASRGRKRGMGLIFATQRLAMLDKNLIMCNWLFLLRQTLPNDLATYREMGCTPEIAQNLENGQAYVITPTKERAIHQIRERYSESGANTPGLTELEQYRSHSRKRFSRSLLSEFGRPERARRESVSSVVEPHEAGEPAVNTHADILDEQLKFTPEDAVVVIKAYATLAKTGDPVSRTRMMTWLHDNVSASWNNKRWSLLQAICDEYEICVKESK